MTSHDAGGDDDDGGSNMADMNDSESCHSIASVEGEEECDG